MAVWICREIPCSILRVSIYDARDRTSQWKVIAIWISWDLLLFNLERLDILCPRIEHSCEKLWPFKFVESFRCWISSVSIYYVPELDIRVKSYDNLNFSRASVVHFPVCRYIIGITHTPESKVMAIWICRELLCSISSVSIYYEPESEIWVKFFDVLNFSRASMVHFRASRYIRGLTHTPQSKDMAVWIFRDLPCSISSARYIKRLNRRFE